MTRPAHETVRQEAPRLRVVELPGPALHEIALVVDAPEEFLTQPFVQSDVVRVVRAPVDIKLDTEIREVALLTVVVPAGDLIGGGVFL